MRTGHRPARRTITAFAGVLLLATLAAPASAGPRGAKSGPPGQAASHQAPPEQGQGDGFRIEVLSSPAHLVSGGAARVAVHVPPGVPLGRVAVSLDGADVTEAFARDGVRRLEGVVDGLPNGDVVLTVSDASPRRGGDRTAEASATLTNHGDGPMFSGPRQEPFVCTIPEDLGGTAVSGGEPLTSSGEDDCSIDTVVTYIYRAASDGGWHHWDPDAPPAMEDVARTQTLDGRHVPFVVRWERGTINRFIHSIAMLAPPPDGPEDLSPDAVPDTSVWNQRLIYHFQGGVGIGHYQGEPSRSRMLYDWGLANGYAIAYSTGTKTGVHYNLELGGETAIMVKDRFVTAYGDPLYTVGVGGSGGGIQQYVYGQNHPWLIDAAIPQYSYPDMVTQTIHVGDCELLERWADFEVLAEGDAFWAQWSNRSLIEGLNAVDSGVVSNPFAEAMPWMAGSPGSSECVNGWRGLSPLALNPNFGAAPGIELSPGVEWTHYGDADNVYGRNDDGYANSTWDNVGVQYGLEAYTSGDISFEEFLDLNANVGSWVNEPDMVQEGCPFLSFLCPDPSDLAGLSPVPDIWPNLVDPWSARNMAITPLSADVAPRRAADPEAVEGAYEHGHVFVGDIDIPIIDWRHYLEPWLDMHNSHQSFASRQRMLNHDGDASNQVVWFTMGAKDDDDRFDQTPMAFRVIDEWMRNLRQNPDAGVAANRPAAAVDSCFDVDGNLLHAGERVWDGILDDGPAGPCTEQFPVKSTSRIVAGGPISGDVFKCHRQSVAAAIEAGVYGDAVSLDSAQQDQLETVFPDGVCDYSQGDALRPDLP